MRGLKSEIFTCLKHLLTVASLADAWIEMIRNRTFSKNYTVASLADAWIEISYRKGIVFVTEVASLADAWIEM